MTDTPEAVRLEFERYFLESRKSKGANRKPTFERFEDGTYKDDHTQRHWWTWQNALLRRIPELERLVSNFEHVCLEAMASLKATVAERDRLRAELGKVRVPEGWRLVPEQMTDAMRDAGNEWIRNRYLLQRAWHSAVTAAPTPPHADQKGQ